jgi:adenylate kinase family enzyme
MERQTAIIGKWDFVFLLGESGGGKGTLVKNIKKYWLPDLDARSMGDIFREKAKTDEEIKRLTDEGVLIGDDIAFRMFRELVAESAGPGLVDGFPRNREQALDAIKFIKEHRWRVLVIDITCDIEVIIERLLQRGREDDKLSIMYKRNQTHKMHHPIVMEEIKNRRDLFDVITINGNQPSEIAFTNFMLNVLRMVDMLYLYNINMQLPEFVPNKDEMTINPAVNRFICDMLRRIQNSIDEK